jgi:hypothetical protein
MTVKANGELQYLAGKFGWKAEPLTLARINRMTADESDWHSRFNGEEYTRAFNEPKVEAAAQKAAAEETEKTERIKAENAKNLTHWEGKKFWDSEPTPELLQKVQEEAAQFHLAYPQFVRNAENGTAIRDWCVAHSLSLTATNMSKAFQALTREGRLTLNPTACGIIRIRMGDGTEVDIKSEELPEYRSKNAYLTTVEGKGVWRKTIHRDLKILPAEEAITGDQLAKHPLLKILLTRFDSKEDIKRRRDESSADQFLKDFLIPIAKKELGQERSQIERNSFDQALESFRSLHPEYILSPDNAELLTGYLAANELEPTLVNLQRAYEAVEVKTNPNVAVSVSGRTAITTAGVAHSGAVAPTSSLTAKINRMSAKEYQEWLQVPSNRAAANALVVGHR